MTTSMNQDGFFLVTVVIPPAFWTGSGSTCLFDIYNNDWSLAGEFEYWFRKPQIEAKSYATPFVDGIRPEPSVFLPLLIQPGNYSISCFQGGKTYGKASIGFGEIILENRVPAGGTVGPLDYILNYAFDGREAVLRRSQDITAPYPSAWRTVWTGTLDQPLPKIDGYNTGDITIPWRDRMVELQVPLPLAIYKGDNELPNGTEGTADDLKNKQKALVLGQVLEVAGVCVNTAKQIWAFSPPTGGMLDLVEDFDALPDVDAVTDFFGVIMAGSAGEDLIEDFDALPDVDAVNEFFGVRRSGIANATIRIAGAVIPQEAEYADVDDMMANAPTPGYCRILRTHGYARFDETPNGPVTASCTDASGARHTIGSLVRSSLRDYMRWPITRLNSQDLLTLETDCSLPMGVWIKDSSWAVDKLLDYFCQSCGCCYYFDENGIFRIFQVTDPALQPADFTLTALQMKSITRVNNDGIPAKAIRLRQQRNWTVQISGLAGSVSAADRAFLATEWRENLSNNIVTAGKHLLAPTLEFDTAFAVDAQVEADRKRDLYSVRRDFYEIDLAPLEIDFTTLRMGMVGNIEFAGRLECGLWKKMLLTGLSADLKNNKITPIVWG